MTAPVPPPKGATAGGAPAAKSLDPARLALAVQIAGSLVRSGSTPSDGAYIAQRAWSLLEDVEEEGRRRG